MSSPSPPRWTAACSSAGSPCTTWASTTGCSSTAPSGWPPGAAYRSRSCPTFEPGGPRRKLYFDPKKTKVGIVTCGGLCPGLNNVIRGLVGELAEHYGVHSVLGFRDGYLGLTPDGAEPVELTPESVRWINQQGGTVLGTSRGGQDPRVMVETLRLRHIDVLFVIGGDGSLRGAQTIADEAQRRGLSIAVVGVPKTIDNDIPWIDRSFGFQTAFGQAAESIRAAATEARSHPGGVGLVKLMGRHSGFIAAYATLASDDVDLVLIPEVPTPLGGERGVLAHVERTLDRQGHALVVVAEGYGQDMFTGTEGGARPLGQRQAVRHRQEAARRAQPAPHRVGHDVPAPLRRPGLRHPQRAGQQPRLGVLHPAGPGRGARRDGRSDGDGRRALARPVRQPAHPAGHPHPQPGRPPR